MTIIAAVLASSVPAKAQGRTEERNSVLKPCWNWINPHKRHVFFNPWASSLTNFKGLLWVTEVLVLPKYLVKYEAKPWIKLLSFVQVILSIPPAASQYHFPKWKLLGCDGIKMRVLHKCKSLSLIFYFLNLCSNNLSDALVWKNNCVV